MPSCRSANTARNAQRPPDLLADDNAPERWGQDDLRTKGPHAVGDLPAAGLGLSRMLKHKGALEIAWAVQPGGQPEVSFEQRTHLAEAIEHGIGSD
jgi:hypothetical protein